MIAPRPRWQAACAYTALVAAGSAVAAAPPAPASTDDLTALLARTAPNADRHV